MIYMQSTDSISNKQYVWNTYNWYCIELETLRLSAKAGVMTMYLSAVHAGCSCRAGSSPTLAEVRRFSYIAHGTRTGARSRVRTVRYCLYDVYTVRMHQDIAPMRVPTAPATLQSHRHTQNDTDTAHDHALQSCSMRHDLSHMHA